MKFLNDIADFFNDNTGVTLLIGTIGYFIKEWISMRTSKKLMNFTTRSKQIDPKTYETEKELYNTISEIRYIQITEENEYILYSEKIKEYIITNDLYIRESISKIAVSFSDYLLESFTSGRNVKKEEKFLKQLKKLFRS